MASLPPLSRGSDGTCARDARRCTSRMRTAAAAAARAKEDRRGAVLPVLVGDAKTGVEHSLAAIPTADSRRLVRLVDMEMGLRLPTAIAEDDAIGLAAGRGSAEPAGPGPGPAGAKPSSDARRARTEGCCGAAAAAGCDAECVAFSPAALPPGAALIADSSAQTAAWAAAANGSRRAAARQSTGPADADASSSPTAAAATRGSPSSSSMGSRSPSTAHCRDDRRRARATWVAAASSIRSAATVWLSCTATSSPEKAPWCRRASSALMRAPRRACASSAEVVDAHT